MVEEVKKEELPLFTIKKAREPTKEFPVKQGLVSQPTAMPTNKWLVYTGGILAGLLIESITEYFLPGVLADQFWVLFPLFLGGTAAYFVNDQRNS